MLKLMEGAELTQRSLGYEFYKRLQAPDGHWSGEYGGPLCESLRFPRSQDQA